MLNTLPEYAKSFDTLLSAKTWESRTEKEKREFFIKLVAIAAAVAASIVTF